MNDLVSIVITYYNYPQYIGECLASCFKQTYSPIEVIVVDDGSTTPLPAFDYPGVTWLRHKVNKGYSAAKNTGIRAAKGKYIALIDADDKLPDNSIAVRVKKFEKYPSVDLVHGIALRWYGGDDTRGYNKKTYIHAQGRMYRREVYERFGLYYEPLRSMSDKEFVYRLGVHPDSPFKKKIKEKKTSKVVAWYRKHENAMHKIRKYKKPELNNEIKSIFNKRIKQLAKKGITKQNTDFL